MPNRTVAVAVYRGGTSTRWWVDSMWRSARFPAMPVAAGILLAVTACSAAVTSSPPASSVAQPPHQVRVPAAAAPAFTALAFPARAAGWLLGSVGLPPGTGPSRAEVWHTATAGATWQVQWEGSGAPLSISAPDPEHAWALITCPANTGQPSCGRELIGTADGGRNWRRVTALPAAVNEIQFVSADLGIAIEGCLADSSPAKCPGNVLISHDGGTTWASVLSSANPVFATASPAGQLWAAQIHPGVGLKGGPQGPNVTFLTSVNGGRSWQRLGQLAGIGPLSTRTLVTLAATAEGLAWATVFDMNSCAMHGCGVADLFRTGDGGTTWTQDFLVNPLTSGCASNSIILSVAPDRSAWAATGRNGGACSTPFGLMFRNSGAGWQQLQPWQLAGIGALAAVSHHVAYALSDQGVLARTDDGGQQWTQLLPAAVPTGQLAAVSATTAFGAPDAIDAGAVLRSGNGGRSWDVIAQLPGVITQLDFPSADDGVAVTFRSPSTWQLWRSRDGGVTWRQAGHLPVTSGTSIFGPWISADGHGLLLTVPGNIAWERDSGGVAPVREWTTSTWGASWTRGRLLPVGTIVGPASFAWQMPGGWTGWLVVFNASGNQQIATASGRFLAVSPTTGNVQLIGSGTGFAWAPEYGPAAVSVMELYRTTNNGRTWQHYQIRLPSAEGATTLALLAFSDASHGWLVEGSATWHTSDGGRTWQNA
jgi:photosystem II stability/assembly factor-like uncharacterized protein